jgi:hypothetical protein
MFGEAMLVLLNREVWPLTPLGADRVISALKALLGVVKDGGFYRGRLRFSHPVAQAYR